jgi:hypothetical protein
MYAVKKTIQQSPNCEKITVCKSEKNFYQSTICLTTSKLVLFTLLFDVLCPEKRGSHFQTA